MNQRKPHPVWKIRLIAAASGIVLLALAGLLLPRFSPAWAWRMERVSAYARGVLHPVGTLPADASTADLEIAIPPIPSLDYRSPIPNKSSAPTELPQTVLLDPPAFDIKKDIQDWNNCGPATLALALRMYGWKGDQYTISQVIKPDQTDKNVNIEELAGYVQGANIGLKAVYRVNGNADMIRQFLNAGYPVIVEESFHLDQAFWPNDDLWAAHYLLISGYDDQSGEWITQDSYYGPNRRIAMSTLEQTWKPFNRVILVLYPPDKEAIISSIFSADWDPAINWHNAAVRAQAELKTNPNDSFAWFNLGSDLLALQDYNGSAEAFRKARQLGLPQRMLRYQFGPFAADYALKDAQDLIMLSNASLERTPNSEEVLVWKAKAYLLTNQPDAAQRLLERALTAHPGYAPALDALGLLRDQ